MVKIQRNKHATLTVEEKEVCESLLAQDVNEGGGQATNQQTSLADNLHYYDTKNFCKSAIYSGGPD